MSIANRAEGASTESVGRQPGGVSIDTADTLSLRNTLGKVHLSRESLDEARVHFTHNLEAARRLGDVAHQTRASINLGIVSLQGGDADAAAERYAEARRLAADAGDLRNLAIALDNLAVLFHRKQDFSAALALYHQSTAAFRKLSQWSHLAHTALNMAELHHMLGDLDRARRLTEIGRGHIRRHRLRSLEAQCHTLDAHLAAASGEHIRAEQLYRTALESVEPAEVLSSAPLLAALAELQVETGQLDAAEVTLARVEAEPKARLDAMLAASVALTRADLARRRGDTPRARAEAAAAQSAAQEAGDRETRWRALFLEGQLAWDAADRPTTVKSLTEAVDLIDQVARRLPESLRGPYLESPERRAVRQALRRVRAGIAPQQPLLGATPAAAEERVVRTAVYQPHWSERYPQIVGRAPALFAVFNALDRVAGSDAIVLIRGESGTGKELVAAALHINGPRGEGPFVKVNCSAFVESLLLSELFGHEKGAFTGAINRKKGRFELADGGTLFLDEIGDISPNTQVALLRVLQEGTLERVGGAETLSVNVRVICATHRNLEEMVRRGEFRADLYYRLRGVIIDLPSLRDRRTDIPVLVEHFLARRTQGEVPPLRITPEALASLMLHDWPGNVRELENVIRSASLFADGGVVTMGELRELGDIFRTPDEQAILAVTELLQSHGAAVGPAGETRRFEAAAPTPPMPPADVLALGGAPVAPIAAPAPLAEAPNAGGPFDADWLERAIEAEGGLSELKKRIEFEAIARALRACGGNITRAAERLGMKRPRLSQIIHEIPALQEFKREAGDP